MANLVDFLNNGYTHATAMQGIDNFFTGNLDYSRSLETMDKMNSFNAAEAQKNRDYQTEMSNSAYQRAVADMKAAGLNPSLVISQGGASAPSGSTAHSGGAPSYHSGQGFQGLLSLVTAGISSAFGLAREAMRSDTLQKLAKSNAQSAYELARFNKRSGLEYFDKFGNSSGGYRYF